MATRESEKQLMKELEQAVKDADKAKDDLDAAKAVYDVVMAKYRTADNEVFALADAIAALRGEGDRNAIVKEAREKGNPVA